MLTYWTVSFFSSPHNTPEAACELPPRGGIFLDHLCAQVLAAYSRDPGRYRGARILVLHPDDTNALAIVALSERGDFASDTLECPPRVATVQYQGRTFTLLERPRPLRPH